MGSNSTDFRHKASLIALRQHTGHYPKVPGHAVPKATMKPTEKIAMKRAIAEDCSGEKNHKKMLLYCLADRSAGSRDRAAKKGVDKHALTSTMGLGSHSTKTTQHEDTRRIYGCKSCRTRLAYHDDILSRVRLLLSCWLHMNAEYNPEFPRPTRQSLFV